MCYPVPIRQCHYREDSIAIRLPTATPTAVVVAIAVVAPGSLRPFLTTSGFVDRKVTPLMLHPIQRGDCCIGFLPGFHRDECETPGTTGIPIVDGLYF